MKFTLKLLSPNDVKEFVNITSQYDYDIDLKNGTYVIDAKSLLGVMGACTRRQMELSTAREDVTLKHRLQNFIVA